MYIRNRPHQIITKFEHYKQKELVHISKEQTTDSSRMYFRMAKTHLPNKKTLLEKRKTIITVDKLQCFPFIDVTAIVHFVFFL